MTETKQMLYQHSPSGLMPGVFRKDHSDNLGDLFKALSKMQGDVGNVTKDSTNPHYRSKYASLAAVWETIREPLAANGLSVLQTNENDIEGVTIVTWLCHTSGQYIKSKLHIPVNKMDAQGVGSAITYGRRYGLMAMVGIAPEDDDGNEAKDNPPTNNYKKKDNSRSQDTTPPAPQGNGNGNGSTKKAPTDYKAAIMTAKSLDDLDSAKSALGADKDVGMVKKEALLDLAESRVKKEGDKRTLIVAGEAYLDG